MVRGGGGRRELFAATQSLGQSWSRVSHQPTLPEYPYLMGQRGGGEAETFYEEQSREGNVAVVLQRLVADRRQRIGR